jgi:hypothetical protein
MAVSRVKTSSVLQGFPKSRSLLVGQPAKMAAPTATDGGTGTTVSVTFTAQSGATSYSVISNPATTTQTASSSPYTFTGLTTGTPYTFQIAAINSQGQGGFSNASTSVTPLAPQYYASSMTQSPYVNAWSWSTSTGFGSKFANPSTLPATGTGNGRSLAFRTGNSAIAVGPNFSGASGIEAYLFSGSGFGSKYAAPASQTGQVSSYGTNWNAAGDQIAIGVSASPYVYAYPWTVGSGFGTRYSNPGTALPNFGDSTSWRLGDGQVAFAAVVSPYVSVYNFSSGFGSKYANPSTAIPQVSDGLQFHPNGNYIGCAFRTDSPYIHVYNWSSGFGSKVADPATLPAACAKVAWSPLGTTLVIKETASTMQAYAWSSGFGTKYADHSTLNSGTFINEVSWNANSDVVGFSAQNADPGNNAFPFSVSTGWGTKYADPAGATSSAYQGSAFTNQS